MPSTHPSVEAMPCILGIDVAKDTVVLHDSASGQTLTIANSPGPLKKALATFVHAELVVCEATGGYERATLDAALAVGIAAHKAEPARVKAFIRSHGGYAKTDAIDARWLTRYGQDRFHTLQRWQPADPRRLALAGLVRYRQDLLKQRTQAKNRRKAPGSGPVVDLLDDMVQFLDSQLVALDKTIAATIASLPEIAQAERVLRGVAGFGPVVSRSLLALMPELGTLSRRQAASLSGLAPHPRDSGQSRQHRHMRGGRTELRPLLFMAALTAARVNPALCGFYERLCAAGKPKRLALAAVARKLIIIANTLLRPITNQKQLT